MALSKHDINLLREYFSDKPVKRVYLFGSYARNTAVEGSSDVDIVLEFDYSKPIGMKFISYQRELEDILHKKSMLLPVTAFRSMFNLISKKIRF